MPSGLVTFVFTDIEGSTALLNRLGRTDYTQALVRHREIIRQSAKRLGGHVVSTPGDEVFLAFGDGLTALLALRDAFDAIAKEPWPQGAGLRVRAGAHAGEAAPRGRDYVSMAVHQAARVGAAAHGGQILVSSSVANEVAGKLPAGLALREIGTYVLRDFPFPESLFQLYSEELASDFPAPRTVTAISGNLPVMRDSFVGRLSERNRLREDIRRCQLISLVGPGGVGKSRLAAEFAATVADGFPHGVWRLELSELVGSDSLVPAVAQVLGITLPPMGDGLDVVVREIDGHRLLLLLDNCECLVDQVAPVVSVLSALTGVTVIATSRSPIGLPGEVVHRIGPMLDTDAKDLFLDRARAVGASALDEQAVEDIVRDLDGIPLCLELAAASTSSLGLSELAARLDDRFRLLRSGSRRNLAHHRTLRAMVDWSHNLLNNCEQVLFRRLSVFSGGFTLDAAGHVCSAEPLAKADVEATLAGLVDKSMVHVAPSPSGEPRYTLLETLRIYAAERLAEAGEAPDTRRRHLEVVLDFAETVESGLMGPYFRKYLLRCAEESRNVIAALNWPLDDAKSKSDRLQLVTAIGGYWTVSDKGMTALPLWRSIIDDAADLDTESVLRAKLVLAARLSNGPDPESDIGLLEGLLEEASREVPSVPHVHARSLCAWAHANAGNHSRAEAEIHSAVEEAAELDDQTVNAFVALYASNVFGRAGRLPESLSWAAKAAEIAEANGQLRMFMLAEAGVGWAYLAQGNPLMSAEATQRALQASLDTSSLEGAAVATLNLGHIERMKGHWIEAAEQYCEGYSLGSAASDQSLMAEAVEGLIMVSAEGAATRDGARLLGVARRLRSDDHPLEPVLRPAYKAAVTRIESILDEDELHHLAQEGAEMSPEEVTSLVRRVAQSLNGVPTS